MPPKKKFKLHGKETMNSRPCAMFCPPMERPKQPGKNDPAVHGEVLGDQRVFTDGLQEIDDNDQPVGGVVGEHSGHCTLVRVGPANERIYQCFATFRLPDGFFTGRTIFDLNNVPGGQLKAAITGGTDGYSKARGEVKAIFKPGNVTIFEIDLT
jgi:hypothetical protein